MTLRLLALAALLTACADPYESYCADEARCEDDNPDQIDGCIRDFEDTEASAANKDCDPEWREFAACAASLAVCEDPDSPDPDWGLQGDDCDEEEDAFDRCMG